MPVHDDPCMVLSPPRTRLEQDDGHSIVHPVVDVVVPVYNEATQLSPNVRRLRSYLDREFPFTAVVTIVDNGSTDGTLEISAGLSKDLEGVRFIGLAEKGRGRALRAAWSLTDAEVVCYMDVDLSTSLDALLPLVAPLLSGHSDLAIGSRLAPGAKVVRGAKRELISRTYNLILRAVLRNRFSDAQCGFKAVRTDVARKLLPMVDDESWFFDTELLVVAERSNLRIYEVPVDWVDDPDSRVRIVNTALDDLRGVVRLLLSRHQTGLASDDAPVTRDSELLSSARRFAKVGLASTVVYGLLFFGSRGWLGTYGANLAALVICTIANTWTHRRVSSSGDGAVRQGLVLGTAAAFVPSLAFTSLALLAAGGLGGGFVTTILALVIATGLAAIVRFSIFRSLTFRASCNEQKVTTEQ
jgi:cellulose synthase/poly-beta-1,6-N-acetylglucosamine synthase-like glycosyltransferase